MESKLKVFCDMCKTIGINKNFMNHLSTIGYLYREKKTFEINIYIWSFAPLYDLFETEEGGWSNKDKFKQRNPKPRDFLIVNLIYKRKLHQIMINNFRDVCKKSAINAKEHDSSENHII